jgi:hypothetical protein
MAAPTCPDLACGGSVTTAAALTLTAALDALYTSATATVNDKGVSIATANRSQVTKGGAPTDYVLIEPNAASPVAGKFVVIICGSIAGLPGNGSSSTISMIAPDTAIAAQLYIGIYMANSGQTVSRADYTGNWYANSALAGWNGTNGTFSGFTKFYGVLTTVASVTVFPSAEDYLFQIETSTGTQYAAEAGLGIRGVSTDPLDSESGLLGRVFTLSTTGSAAAISATWMTANYFTASGMLGHYTSDKNSHCYYRVPGATTNSSVNTMRYCAWFGTAALVNGLPSSNAAQYIAASGAIEPDYVGIADGIGIAAGGRAYSKVGRHRYFFFGPRKRSRYTLSTGGVAKWISAGSATSTSDANDCVLLPM